MIVSTAVPDVVRNFGTVVKIAKDQEEFISICKQALEEPDESAIARGLQMTAENTWEQIVARMEGHIQTALLKKHASGIIA
jgi:hypothetical protein